jgi:hypothetical protein
MLTAQQGAKGVRKVRTRLIDRKGSILVRQVSNAIGSKCDMNDDAATGKRKYFLIASPEVAFEVPSEGLAEHRLLLFLLLLLRLFGGTPSQVSRRLISHRGPAGPVV